MQEVPHPEILNRDEAKAQVDKHLPQQLVLLRDLANYGSNLVLRAYNSSDKATAAVIVCGVLLKQVVAMVDAVEILLSAGISHAAYPSARAAFEASLYIDFILMKNSEDRALCYLVGNYREGLLWAKRAQAGSPEAGEFESATDGASADMHQRRPELAAIATAQLAEIRRIMQQPAIGAVDQRFKHMKGTRKFDPSWHEVAGARSVAEVARQVGRYHEYVVFYDKGSLVTHSASYRDHLIFSGGDQIRLKPIRHIADINNLLRFVGTVAMHSYNKVLTRYRPGEILAFVKKYKDDWRDPFLNAVQINYPGF